MAQASLEWNDSTKREIAVVADNHYSWPVYWGINSSTSQITPITGSVPPLTVVLVHGGFADGSGWQGVYNQLMNTYSVRVVQEPNLSHTRAMSPPPR